MPHPFTHVKRYVLFVARRAPTLWRPAGVGAPPSSLLRRAGFLLRGHDPVAAARYVERHGTLADRLSEFRYGAARPAGSGRHSAFLDNSVVLRELLASHALPHTRLLGFYVNHRWYWREGDVGRDGPVLPATGGWLEPVRPHRPREKRALRTGDALAASFSEDVAVVENPPKADYLRAIVPTGAADLRLLLCRDGAGRLRVDGALHHFATRRSAGSDDFETGALLAPIDVAAGRLGPALCRGDDGGLVERVDHPDTAAPIAGVAIPCWDAVSALVDAFSEALPFIRFAELVVTPTSAGPAIAGAAATPDPELFQLYKPWSGRHPWDDVPNGGAR